MVKDNYYSDVFARNYDRITSSGYYDYNKEVRKFKKIVKGKHLLELGIGTGCLAELLIVEGYIIEGIEPSTPMIKELEKKGLPIKVYQQDASSFDTGKKYDAILSHGSVPMAVMREDGVFFDTYVIEKEGSISQMKRIFEHLKDGGHFLCGIQPGKNDNIEIGDFYKNRSVIENDIITKTHFFREGGGWSWQTVTARVWPEEDFIQIAEKSGLEVLGLNSSKTWYVFHKP